MNYRNPTAAFILSIALVLGAQSSVASEQSISLVDAIRFTMESNPRFRTYQLRSQALAGELQTADQKPVLRVSTEIENVLGTGDLNWFQGTELSLSLSQVIEMGDKRFLRTNTVNRRHNLLLAEQQVLELDLLSEATSRYIELATIEEIQVLLARATDLAQISFEAVSSRVVAGRAPEAERARATAALALAELAQNSAGFDVAAAKLKLSSLWGELQPEFGSTEARLMEVEELSDINLLLQKLEENPEIQVFASESRLREAELRAARSQRKADIEVGAGIRHLAELNDTALIFQASIPLSTKQRASGAITTAQANLLRVDSEREAAVLRMKAQLLTLTQQRMRAVNEFTLLQESVLPQLENALDSTRAAFESGRYSYLELSAAQQQLLDAQLSLIEAASRAHLLRVEIERLSGETYKQLNLPNRETPDVFSGATSR